MTFCGRLMAINATNCLIYVIMPNDMAREYTIPGTQWLITSWRFLFPDYSANVLPNFSKTFRIWVKKLPSPLKTVFNHTGFNFQQGILWNNFSFNKSLLQWRKGVSRVWNKRIKGQQLFCIPIAPVQAKYLKAYYYGVKHHQPKTIFDY